LKIKGAVMNRNTWKAQEREYAKLINGERIPVTGRSGSEVPDITSFTIVGEVKKSNTGKTINQRTLKALKGIKEIGNATGKLPVLLQAHKDKGKRDIEHVVTMYLEDFLFVAEHLIKKNEEYNQSMENSKKLNI
tara:strand:+ start:366 stop:767 length:402 start_codon:yes stop_codon:yes gene_type:complete